MWARNFGCPSAVSTTGDEAGLSVMIRSPTDRFRKSDMVIVVSARMPAISSRASASRRAMRFDHSLSPRWRPTINQLWELRSVTSGSITLNGRHRLIVPARFVILISNPMTTTTSLGGTI